MDPQSRQEYVRAAISFLQNPKLVDSSLKDKLKFLKDKGLSELEVDEALNLALVNRHQTQSSRWNFVLILGLCIGGYKLYQTYLEQEKAKKGDVELKKTEPSIKLTPKIDERVAEHDNATLNEILQKMAELKKLIELQRSNFGTEIQSLKTLLLGHEKFAAPPKIPEWQLAPTDRREEEEEEEPERETSVEKNGDDSDEKKPTVNEIFIEPTMIGPNLE